MDIHVSNVFYTQTPCFRMCVMISRQFRMLREILGCCKKKIQ